MEKICSATYNYPSKEEYLKKARLVLQKYFGFNEFRPHQLDCIKKLWEHGSCFVLSPTGSGKSLCYTIPALLEKGLSLVISPLISLMDDQVINLKNKGILAERFHSNLGSEEKRKIIESIKDSKLKLLYISPERFARDDFRELLRKYHNIDLIAIDEAHCISDWGYFRSEYKNIGIYLKEFLEAKKILLTATLTQDKLEYIKSILDIKDIQVVNVNQIRTNLIIKNFGFYHEEEKIISLVRSLLEEKGSGIIYACTRKRVEETYEILTQKFRISCCKFHGGMSSEEK